jgi:hypothetical protein
MLVWRLRRWFCGDGFAPDITDIGQVADFAPLAAGRQNF